MEFWQTLLGLWHKAVEFYDTAFIGVIGAGVAYFMRPKDGSAEAIDARRQFVVFLISGGTIAYFTAPSLMRAFAIDAGFAGSVAFFAGALGGSMLTAILKAIDNLDLWPFVKSLVRAKLGIKDTNNVE